MIAERIGNSDAPSTKMKTKEDRDDDVDIEDVDENIEDEDIEYENELKRNMGRKVVSAIQAAIEVMRRRRMSEKLRR